MKGRRSAEGLCAKGLRDCVQGTVWVKGQCALRDCVN